MTIAIYREATSISKSTKSHLLIRQDYSNRTEKGANFGKDNILITFNGGQVQEKILFNRTETSNREHTKPIQDLQFKNFSRLNNSNLLSAYENLENIHFKQIKEYFETTKTQQKQQAYQDWENAGKPENQKPKKTQTVYKGKPDTTHKEFLIAFGGIGVINQDKAVINQLDNPDFYKLAIKAVKKQLLEMGLSDRNLVSIIFHRDEKTPHLHIRYTNFDFKNCQSLNTTIENKCNKDKKQIIKYRQNLLSNLQKTINKSFNFDYETQQKDPTRKHKTKREWLQEQNQELTAQQSKKLSQLTYLDNQLEEKKEELEEEYLKFDFKKLATKYTYSKAREKIEELKDIGINPAGQGHNINLVDLFIRFLKMQLGKRFIEYQQEKATFLSIKQNTKQVQPIRTKTIDKQITR